MRALSGLKRGRREHTPETDARMLELHARLGDKWREITRQLGGAMAGYSDDLVRNRVLRVLNRQKASAPRVSTRVVAPFPTAPWTECEDNVLLSMPQTRSRASQYGFHISWVVAVAKLKTVCGTERTTHAARNRFYRLVPH